MKRYKTFYLSFVNLKQVILPSFEDLGTSQFEIEDNKEYWGYFAGNCNIMNIFIENRKVTQICIWIIHEDKDTDGNDIICTSLIIWNTPILD